MSAVISEFFIGLGDSASDLNRPEDLTNSQLKNLSFRIDEAVKNFSLLAKHFPEQTSLGIGAIHVALSNRLSRLLPTRNEKELSALIPLFAVTNKLQKDLSHEDTHLLGQAMVRLDDLRNPAKPQCSIQ